MLESEKLAIAAHLHVVMRRKIGRVTDVEWLLRSPEYAREIIRIAQSEPQHPEMIEWAGRLQDALFAPSADSKKAAAAAMADAQDSTHQASGFLDSRLGGLGKAVPKPPAPRYVGSLR